MLNTGDNELEKIRQEHCNHVLERYRSTSRSFRRGLIILISFAIAFFWIILFPYYSVQHENSDIDGRLKPLSADIARHQKNMDAYGKVINGINTLRREIKRSPQRLRDFILDLSQSPNAQTGNLPNNSPMIQQQMPVQQQLTPEDSCGSLQGAELVNCRVRQEVLRQFKDYEDIITREVVGPLDSLGDDSALPIDTAALQDGLDNLQASFIRELDENPRFWQRFRDKVGFSVRLDDAVTRFWSEYDTVMGKKSETLKQELKTLEDDKAKLGGRQDEMKARKKQIAARLSQIETPLGKLSVGLSESILAFPIALAIGFLILIVMLKETMRLRRVFHSMYQRKDPGRAVLTDRQVALIAPLWIDSIDPGQNRAFRFAVLFIPLVIFVVACFLIFYLWTLPGSFPTAGKLQKWVYSVLYAFSTGAFIYGSLQAVRAVRHYSDARPGDSGEI